MMYLTPLTDEEIEQLAEQYMADPRCRQAMAVFGMTREDYIQSLRRLYPVPTYSTT